MPCLLLMPRCCRRCRLLTRYSSSLSLCRPLLWPTVLQAKGSEKKRATTAATTIQLYKQIIIGLYVSEWRQAQRLNAN